MGNNTALSKSQQQKPGKLTPDDFVQIQDAMAEDKPFYFPFEAHTMPLSDSEFRVYFHLHCVAYKTRHVWQTITHLANDMGKKRDTIIAALRRLCELKMIERLPNPQHAQKVAYRLLPKKFWIKGDKDALSKPVPEGGPVSGEIKKPVPEGGPVEPSLEKPVPKGGPDPVPDRGPVPILRKENCSMSVKTEYEGSFDHHCHAQGEGVENAIPRGDTVPAVIGFDTQSRGECVREPESTETSVQTPLSLPPEVIAWARAQAAVNPSRGVLLRRKLARMGVERFIGYCRPEVTAWARANPDWDKTTALSSPGFAPTGENDTGVGGCEGQVAESA